MTEQEKAVLKGQIQALKAQNQIVASLLSVPPPPIMPTQPFVPILIGPALGPLVNAVKKQTEVVDSLIVMMGKML